MDKFDEYRARAEDFRRMAREQTCDDAREYYEALERDFLKLAAKVAQLQPQPEPQPQE